MDSEKNEPLLSDKKITATMSENVFRSILDKLGAQLGRNIRPAWISFQNHKKGPFLHLDLARELLSRLEDGKIRVVSWP